MKKEYDFIITGSGAAGLQLLYRLMNDNYFNNFSILLIDKEKKTENDRTWCFWEKGKGEWDAILEKTWNQIVFKSEIHSEETTLGDYRYKMIRSSNYYEFIISKAQQRKNISIVYDNISDIEEKEDKVIVKAEKQNYTGKKVFNSIVFDKTFLTQKKYPSLKQHFVGWFIHVDKPIFDDSKATFMDFKIPQEGNTRFMYILPLNKTTALFEYTLFSKDELSFNEYEQGIKDYLATYGIENYKLVEKEQGVIPMTSFKFWKQNTKNIVNIGTVGGWSKASTGFTFMNISKNTEKLVEYLKTRQPFTEFHKTNRFWYYDLLLLEVLEKENWRGSSIFGYLFKNNPVSQIFKFLDEQTNLAEEIKIMGSIPSFPFIKALFRRF